MGEKYIDIDEGNYSMEILEAESTRDGTECISKGNLRLQERAKLVEGYSEEVKLTLDNGEFL